MVVYHFSVFCLVYPMRSYWVFWFFCTGGGQKVGGEESKLDFSPNFFEQNNLRWQVLPPTVVNKVVRGEAYSPNPWEIDSAISFAPQRGATTLWLVRHRWWRNCLGEPFTRGSRSTAHPWLPCFPPLGQLAQYRNLIPTYPPGKLFYRVRRLNAYDRFLCYCCCFSFIWFLSYICVLCLDFLNSINCVFGFTKVAYWDRRYLTLSGISRKSFAMRISGI